MGKYVIFKCLSCSLQFGSESESVEGSYSFTSPEGQEVAISYTADENGYFPKVKIK